MIMEDFLYFTGPVRLIITERAPINKGKNANEEGQKKILSRAIINEKNLLTAEIKDKISTEYVYDNFDKIIIKTEKNKSGEILELKTFEYNKDNLIKTERMSPDNTLREKRVYKYNKENLLISEISGNRKVTYKYNEQQQLVNEFRYYGIDPEIALQYDYNETGNIKKIITLNEKGKQIRIQKFKWDENLLTAEYCLNENNVILKDDLFEYTCFHEGNWLKRVKYSLVKDNIRKPIDVIYRSITYSDNCPQIKPINKKNYQVLEENEKSLTFSDGSSYRGSLYNGKMDGNGFIKWTDGSSYKGDFKDNLMDGKGILTWPNGDIYCGSFKNGKMDGVGRLRWKNGKTFYGLFENNNRTNQGIIEED